MNIAVPAAYDSDASITKAELKTYLGTGLIITGIVQADLSAGVTGAITSTGAPSVDPNAGWYNPAVANGATRVLSLYHGGVSRAVGIPWGYLPWASLPAVGDIDERYRVTDTQTLVGYRTAAVDEVLAGTGNSFPGWHPLAGGYGLFDNQSGATINQGETVALVAPYLSNSRRVRTTTVQKDQTVIGVAMHTVLTGNPILVALLGCQDVIQVKVDPTIATGDVDAGDVLVSSSTVGVARSVGTMTAGSFLTVSGSLQLGAPLGAFAIAIKDRAAGDGVGLVPARMLAGVGRGCLQVRTRALIKQYDNANRASIPTGLGWTQVFAARSASGVAGAQSAADDLYADAKHAPMVAAGIGWAGDLDSGTTDLHLRFRYTKDAGGGSVHGLTKVKRWGSATLDFAIQMAAVPTLADGSFYMQHFTDGAAFSNYASTNWELALDHYFY